MDFSDAMIRTSVISQRKKPALSPSALVPVRSALLFLLVFTVGLLLYFPLSPVLCELRCIPAERFLAGLAADPATLSEWLSVLFSMLARDWLLFGFVFFVTFSYFCDFLSSLAVCADALTVGLAVGYLNATMRAGACPVLAFTCFLLCEGISAAFFLLYTCRAAFLSARMRHFGRRQFFLSLRLSCGHFARTLFNMLILYAVYAVFVMIL